MSGRKRRRESRFFRYFDPSERPITPTDVKQYIFCPLVVYYSRALKLKPVMDSQQEESRERHRRIRGPPPGVKGEVLRCPPLYCERLNIYGELDLLLKSGDELIPIDYKFSKSMKGKAWPDHKYQLALYAILVEEAFSTVVRRGLIYYVGETLVEVRITRSMKEYVKRIIKEIREIERSGSPPRVRKDPERCSGGCGYGWVCKG